MTLQFYYIFMDGLLIIETVKENGKKKNPRILVICLLLAIFSTSQAQKTYTLISKKTEKLNKPVIASLPSNLKAMAAFYSAMGGTNCLDQECALTTALGLGKQGSDLQKSLIVKYFPDDKAAKLVVAQDCYLAPASASAF